MVEIPEDLLRRSAEAKAKALGVPDEQVLAEMRGEAPPSTPPAGEAPPAPKPQPGASAQLEEEGVVREQGLASPSEAAPGRAVQVAGPGGSAPGTRMESEWMAAGQVTDAAPPAQAEMEGEPEGGAVATG